MKKSAIIFAALFGALLLPACGDKDGDTGEHSEHTSADPDATCLDLCETSGFTGSSAELYEHELNCFCEGDAGEVTDAGCEDMCTDLGYSSAQAFDVNACQCS